MKIVNLNALMTIILILSERKNFSHSAQLISSNSIINDGQKNPIPIQPETEILVHKKLNISNHSEVILDIQVQKNHTISFTNKKTTNAIKKLLNNHIMTNINISESDLSLNSKENFHNPISLEEKIKSFEINKSSLEDDTKITPTNPFHNKFIKKKYRGSTDIDDDGTFMFYNSLSLIMLSMLAGGLVGVIFILYFSFKDDSIDIEKN